MNLKVQVLSLIFSLFFGVVFSYFYSYFYKLFYKTKFVYKILINFLFVLDFMLLYFLLLIKINNGILHIYFFATFIFSFLIFNKYNFYLRKYLKVQYDNKKRKNNVK